MALNFFKQRDIDEMDVNDIPEEFINYLETLDEAGKIGLLASRPDIAKVLGVSVEDSNQDTVNTTDDSSEIVQEDERNPKSSAVFEEEQDIRNSVNVEPDVDEPEEVNEEFIAIQNNYYEGKRLAEILKDNMEPLEALAIPDKTDKCFIHRVPFKEKQIRYTGKGATYGVVLKICPQCNRIYLEESGKEYIHEALTKRNIAHTFYSLETSNQYLRSQIKAYEIADQDKIYIPEIWTEDNPLCPVHEEALFEIPCIKKYKDRKVEFTGYFCDKCNKILMRSSSVAELEDNCALNGVPVIETESFVKKRPKKQLIKMREIKSDYIVENGKREIYTYSHAADCFKLTEEDTVVVSDSIYCSLEGHKTEEVLVLIWVNQKKGGRKSYIFVVGYCSQCQKYYIISIPETRLITSNFGRDIELDLSTPDKEYEHKLFPLNIILDNSKTFIWMQSYMTYHNNDATIVQEWMNFQGNIIMPVFQYKIPVILLDKNTPKEAVCQVFENVNTGGVSLTVFELITAVFAMDDFELRKDWEQRKNAYFNGDLLSIISATDFLTACTLLSTYQKGGTVSCKKKDVLNLTLDEYQKYADDLTNGFVEAEKILQEERIFSSKDLPYSTQFIPLAVLCTILSKNNQIKTTTIKNKIKQWYWCGVFGEMYGSANETRYVLDVVGVMDWISDDTKVPKTVQDSYFNPTRLLSLQSRLYIVIFDKAAYRISSKLFSDIASYIDDHYVETHINKTSEVMRRQKQFWEMDLCESISLPEPSNVPLSKAATLEDALQQMDESFSEMLLRKIDESGMTDSQCYKKANIDRKLFSKIKNDKYYKPSKPTVLAFALALELPLPEIQDMLMKAGFALSHSSKFDVIVEYFILKQNYSIYEINEALFAFDQSLIGG